MVTPSTASPPGGFAVARARDATVTEMSSAVQLIDAALLTGPDLPSSRTVERTRERVRVRQRYLHMYVPESRLPVYVVLVGRRRCCGVRWGTTRLHGCSGRVAGPPPRAVSMRALLDRLP